MKKTYVHIAILTALLLAGSSHAQTAGPDLPMRGPDYLRDAADMASVLGAAHAIRVRCNGTDDQYWRRYMADLMSMEAPYKGTLRSRLVDNFNTAYTNTTRDYPYCDTRAVEAEAMYARQGKELATRMAQYYFPKRAER